MPTSQTNPANRHHVPEGQPMMRTLVTISAWCPQMQGGGGVIGAIPLRFIAFVHNVDYGFALAAHAVAADVPLSYVQVALTFTCALELT